MGKELVDLRISIDALVKKVDDMAKVNIDKDKKIEKLLKAIESKDKKIDELNERVTDMEILTNEMKRFTLKNNIIIRGLHLTKIQNRSYAAVSSQTPQDDASANPEPVVGHDHRGSSDMTTTAESRRPAVDTFRHTRKELVQFIRQ